MQNFLHTLFLDDRLRTARFGTGIVVFVAIVLVGAIPGARANIGDYATGIVLHSLGYGTISMLLFTGMNGSLRYRFVRTLLSVAVMGAIDELIQSFLPYRRGALSDWIVDCTASLAVCSMLMFILPEPRASQA